MEKIKKIFLGLLTFLCVIIIMLDIVCYSLRKVSKNYLKESTIKEIVDNINITELFKDSNGKELEQITEIKNKFVESGVPKESIDEFIDSKPIHEFTGNIINDSINHAIYGKEIKDINSEYIYSFLENNISNISSELQEKNVAKSELLTKEKQEEILNKVKDKTPIIEEKINELTNKINNKLEGKESYIDKMDKLLKILRFFYSNVIDLILVLIFIIFIIGIVITRRSIYKSLKWIGISFIGASINLYLLGCIIPKIDSYITEVSNFASNLIKPILKRAIDIFTNDSIIFIIIGIILIILNIIIYFIREKIENKQLEI